MKQIVLQMLIQTKTNRSANTDINKLLVKQIALLMLIQTKTNRSTKAEAN